MTENKDSTTKILQNMLDRNYTQGGQDMCESLIEAFNELKSLGEEILDIDRVIYLIEKSKELAEATVNAP